MGALTSSRQPTLMDVAALAGVSRGTASNVLNHPELVSAASRDQVEKAIAELGFVRNEAAHSLRSGRRGQHAERAEAVSITQVAAAARVSLGTVSNVVNRPHLVAADTRRRVEDAITELGWVPSTSAQRLRSRRQHQD